MNVLILVLSARREPWNALMDVQMETWDSESHPNTGTQYYCGKSDRTDLRVWYLARPHSSTYVHKANLVKFCETLPKTDVLCGIMTEGEKPFIWGGCHYLFSRDVIERFVANKDKWDASLMDDGSITKMAQELGVPVTPGWSATINLQPDGSYVTLVYNHGENSHTSDFNTLAEKLNGHFFVRCKQDLRRHEDVRIMRELFKHWK